ncbi:MAG: hypothetical protein ACO242_02290 [Candidatus Fonsibacter ubiquis]
MTTKRLVFLEKNGKKIAKWVKITPVVKRKLPTAQKEDLTIDGYINKYGSIYNHADGKNYTTKTSYLEALKQSGHHIKDY